MLGNGFTMHATALKLVYWADSMSVDGHAIDDSHRQLIALINRLYTVASHGSDRDSIANILCELADYAGSGFLEEEKLMTSSRYAEQDQHVLEHWSFIDTLTIFIADFERGSLVEYDVLKFLIRWVASHIKASDAAFGAHLMKSRSSPFSCITSSRVVAA